MHRSIYQMWNVLWIANIAALLALTVCVFCANHVDRVVIAFALCGPCRAILTLVGASFALLGAWWIVIRAHMDPLRCRPFLAFCNWAASMEAKRVWCAISLKVKEQHSITLDRFHRKQPTFSDSFLTCIPQSILKFKHYLPSPFVCTRNRNHPWVETPTPNIKLDWMLQFRTLK